MSRSISSVIRLLCFLPLLATIGPIALGATAEPMDEFTHEVARYELTMTNLEAYGAVMASLAEWAAARPADAAALRQREPKGRVKLKPAIAHLDAEPVIAARLKAAKLTGRDFVLLPMAVMQAQIAALGEAQGRTFPADRINPKNTAFVRDHEARVREIMAQVATDRTRGFGH